MEEGGLDFRAVTALGFRTNIRPALQLPNRRHCSTCGFKVAAKWATATSHAQTRRVDRSRNVPRPLRAAHKPYVVLATSTRLNSRRGDFPRRDGDALRRVDEGVRRQGRTVGTGGTACWAGRCGALVGRGGVALVARNPEGRRAEPSCGGRSSPSPFTGDVISYSLKRAVRGARKVRPRCTPPQLPGRSHPDATTKPDLSFSFAREACVFFERTSSSRFSHSCLGRGGRSG